MKKISLSLLITILLTSISCKQNAADKVKNENIKKAQERDNKKVPGLPEMTFESTDFDFGTINQGDKVDAIFVFTNTGESDLIITNAKASCGCTVPEWPKGKRIKPGEKGEIKALFDSKSKTNKQNKSVTLTTNTLKGKEVVYVKGFVTPDPNKSKKAKPKTNIK
ncbi:MAG TPA: DUF1573 domain-containing protein [Lutibacter sp.]|nr:DUF1573 domain-containing protein [Lutibacter sp.]